MKKSPKELAKEHWDNYVGPMQRNMLNILTEAVMVMGEYHYVTSHIHGAKHREQDMIETMIQQGVKSLKKAKKSKK